MLTAILAATFFLATSHFSDGSTLFVAGGTMRGQACYHSMRAVCADTSPCEATDAMAKLTATGKQCGYVQPLVAGAETREAIRPVE